MVFRNFRSYLLVSFLWFVVNFHSSIVGAVSSSFPKSRPKTRRIPKKNPHGVYTATATVPATIMRKKSLIDRFVDKMFKDTDVNHDGTISFQEVYEGVLKFYIKLNQQAPIPPPTRDKVILLFLQADDSHTYSLDREEYASLLRKLLRRALFRLAVQKVVTLVGAPLLSEFIVRKLAHKEEVVKNLARWIVPGRFHEKVIPVVTSQGFHRALWITILVATLGNFCLKSVNFLLDLSLPKSVPTDPRLKNFGR
jgi:hypothetical protein